MPKDRCPRGHPLVEGNLRGGKRLASGLRECLACHRERELARNRRAGKAIGNKFRTHCIRGHPLSGDNVTIHNGGRRCVTCHREAAREHRRKNPEDDRRRARAYARAHVAAGKARVAAWKQQHPDRWAAHMARAKRLRRLGKDRTATQYAETVVLQDPCSYCDGPGGTVDHIQSVNRGGSNTWDNLTAACVSCNSAKRDHELLFFLLKQGE